MKKNKNRPHMESEDFLSPWNHQENDTPASSRVRIRHTDRISLQKRNYSQPIDIHTARGEEHSAKCHKIFFQKTRKADANCEGKSPNMKKMYTLFAKTMNITFRSFPDEAVDEADENIRQQTPLLSIRSQCSTPRPNAFRIHSNNPSVLSGQQSQQCQQEKPKQSKPMIRNELIVTSYPKFFPLSSKRNHSTRQRQKNDGRINDVLKLLRNPSRKEDNFSKMVKKVERNHLKKYLQGQRCLY